MLHCRDNPKWTTRTLLEEEEGDDTLIPVSNLLARNLHIIFKFRLFPPTSLLILILICGDSMMNNRMPFCIHACSLLPVNVVLYILVSREMLR